MNRAVVVLLLLIANAVVSSRNNKPGVPPSPPVPINYSLGLFTVVDGAALPEAESACPSQHNKTEAFDDIRL